MSRHASSTAALLFLLAAPGCVFYESTDDDQPPPGWFPDAGWRPDAWRVPDATPPDADPAPLSCTQPLACPGASPNKVTVCGRLYDVETDAQIRSVTQSTGTCGLDASGGACNLEIRFYDAIDFAGNPEGATPLPVEELRLDDCGRFVARNISRPALGYLGIAVDDEGFAPDVRRLTGVARAVTSGQVLNNQRVYSIRRSTDAAWSTTAGLVGPTVVDRGVIWKQFLDGNTPVAGVTITGANGQARASDDYYFADNVASTRQSIAAAQAVTGVNGSALMLNSALVEHSGTGGERNMCWWSSSLAASIAGTLFFSPTALQDGNGQACP